MPFKNCENELAKIWSDSYSSRPARRVAKARIAQLVEQLAFNQLVLGSSPSPRIFFDYRKKPNIYFSGLAWLQSSKGNGSVVSIFSEFWLRQIRAAIE